MSVLVYQGCVASLPFFFRLSDDVTEFAGLREQVRRLEEFHYSKYGSLEDDRISVFSGVEFSNNLVVFVYATMNLSPCLHVYLQLKNSL